MVFKVERLALGTPAKHIHSSILCEGRIKTPKIEAAAGSQSEAESGQMAPPPHFFLQISGPPQKSPINLDSQVNGSWEVSIVGGSAPG
jgi:hypothetical protein